MADLLIKRLEDEIVRQRFNYKSLSLAAGLGETTVRDIITGRARNPRRDTLQKIAKILDKPLSYFLAEHVPIPILEAGTRESFSSLRDVREHKMKFGGDYMESPPELGYRDITAMRLHGSVLLPFLPDGTILYYGERRESDFDIWLDKLCVLQIHKGNVGAYILKRGTLYGCYHLANYNAILQENVTIDWCAKVLFIKPV